MEILYNIFIMPVESIVEFIFYFMNKIFADQPGISIMFVSLVVNLLILPLYKRADDMQEREREKVKSMNRWLKHIKKTFKGDERYMMQTAYYRIEGYKPIYAVTGSLSLLFQIPFFIAAYHFLSNLKLLDNVGFLIIPDLGSPDGIIKLFGLSINLLPILMTLVNIISGVIYTKGFKAKDKIQLYAMALVFLVILYKSPSGLVLYWTCNNLFSLFKNIFFKIVKRKRLAINILSAVAGTGLFVFLLLSHRLGVRREFLLFGLIMAVSYVPAILSLLDKVAPKLKEKAKKLTEVKEDKKNLNRTFILGALFNTVLMGVMIPAELIKTSPVEFGTLVSRTPVTLIVNSFFFYVGFFLVWIGIFYAISKDPLKKIFAYGMWVVSICSLVNYYLFFGKFGNMDYRLKFIETPVYNDLSKLINLFVLTVIAILLIFVAAKKIKIVQNVLSVLILMAVILSGVSIYNTHIVLKNEGYYEIKKDSTIVPTVPLSRDGQNVVVVMLDRAVSEFLPYIFKEKPEVASKFEDFVYYPNTTSFGGCTNYAVPALFGGYEYTPAEMDKRSTEPLVDKHNESLLVLPVLFENAGFEVSVVDPPYANYKEYPDLTLFDGYENITGYATRDKYSDYVYHNEDELKAQKKNVAFYSLFRTVPVLLQNSVYDDGNYLGRPLDDKIAFADCAEAYATLDYLDEYTYIEEGTKNEFFILNNLITHEPTFLEAPDYVISNKAGWNVLDDEILTVEGKKLYLDEQSAVRHYHVNAAAFRLLGDYIDYLKEEGIYDNTRIIIVSDHGWPVNQMENVELDVDTSIETFNPILFVKDFADSQVLNEGEKRYIEESNLTVCDKYMTNADVAVLCMKGIIDNPVNPFTGKVINDDAKNNLPQIITSSRNCYVTSNNGNVFDTSDYPWVEFYGGEVKNRDNWKVLYDKE